MGTFRRSVLGIDAAWTVHHPSGIALVGETSTGWNCVAVAPSYDSFLALAKGVPVDWSTPRFTGSTPDPGELLRAAGQLLGGAAASVVTVDMPVATVPVTARRLADSLVSQKFGAQHCAVHSPTADRPGVLADRLAREFARLGYPVATAALPLESVPALVEVYPHPAIVRLLGLGRRLEYKVANARKFWPEQTAACRKARLLANFKRLLGGLSSVIGEVDLPLPSPDQVRSVAGLKRLEDALDALVCSWVGMAYLTGMARAYGDETAAIWIPE